MGIRWGQPRGPPLATETMRSDSIRSRCSSSVSWIWSRREGIRSARAPGGQAECPPRALPGHELELAVKPAGLQVVVVLAAGLPRLAREDLPLRAVGVGWVGDHPPGGGPDRLVGVVRVE